MNKLKQLITAAREEAVALLAKDTDNGPLIAIKTRLDAAFEAIPAEAPAPAPKASAKPIDT